MLSSTDRRCAMLRDLVITLPPRNTPTFAHLARLIQDIRIAADLAEYFDGGLISEKEMLNLFREQKEAHRATQSTGTHQ